MERAGLVLLSMCLIGLSSCVSTSKILINEQGQQVKCSAQGWGYIGAPMAAANYDTCLKNQKALGFIDLEDHEKREAAKVTPVLDTPAPRVSQPVLEPGHAWVYQLSGARTGVVRQEVASRDMIGGVPAYTIKASQYSLILGEDLNTIEESFEGRRFRHTPPLENYRWPLELGKTWQAAGMMETGTGTIKTSKKGIVKAFGKVRVPAGEFDTYYILSTADDGSRASELWYAPAVKRHVKLVTYAREGRLTAELVSFSLGGPAGAPAMPSGGPLPDPVPGMAAPVALALARHGSASRWAWCSRTWRPRRAYRRHVVPLFSPSPAIPTCRQSIWSQAT